MKKSILKTLVIVVILTSNIILLQAQNNYYYYYKGNKIFLELDTKYLNVFVNEDLTSSDFSYLNLSNYILKRENGLVSNLFAKIEYSKRLSSEEYISNLDKLKNNNKINGIGVYFKRAGGISIGTSNLFYVKLKKSKDYELLEQFSVAKNTKIVSQVPSMPLWYILSTNNTRQTSIELSNQFYESKLFADVDPAFMFDFEPYCVNDPYFNNLWGLKNNTCTDCDINACEAWSISIGSNVNVAIVDQGIEKTHNDLYGNIHNLSFNALTGTSPSGNANLHGTHVAGIVAALKDNNIQVVGVAPDAKLISISHPLTVSSSISAELASGISWAWNNGADIINNSWGDQGGVFYNELYSSILDEAINNAITYGRAGKGAIVVFASGNHSPTMDYPANSNEEILTVGSIDNNGRKSMFSGYGEQLDIVAPGRNILSTITNNSIDYLSGTSMAAPHVAGVAALILSANPNLTGQEVRDIIEKTAQKVRPDLYSYNSDQSHSNGTWNNEMGYGLVDAYAAVRMAKGLVAPADLYVRDSFGDIGDEPSNASRLWASPDIWIEDMAGNRVNPYGDDDYNVCVRIHNRSDNASLGNERLLLNWAKAGIDLNWSGSWTGEEFFNCNGKQVPKGGYVGDINGVVIPSIPAHSNCVIKVKWHVPKPKDYMGCSAVGDQLRHFCLLARVYDGHPILHENESSISVKGLVRDNNNVAWRNVTILEGKQNRGAVSVGNSFKEPRTFSLLYTLFKNEKGELLNKYADVYLNMSSNLFELWQKSDFAGKGFKVVDKNKILLTEPTATIERLVLQPEELYLLEAEVNFFTQENPESNEFMFDIAEYVDDEKGGKELIGGETYIAIRNSERDSYFKAKAVDDKTVLPAEPVSFRAEPISEDAVYTWFDQKGDTVAHGLNLTVTPTSTQHYKLEVVATADGFKDYDSVRATVRNGAIVSLSPNPTDNQLTITYRLAAGITNATIEISDVQNLSVQSYPIAATATTKTVSLAGLTSGTYVVKLIINGETVDTRQVIKN